MRRCRLLKVTDRIINNARCESSGYNAEPKPQTLVLVLEALNSSFGHDETDDGMVVGVA